MVTKGDQFASFRSANLRDVDRSFAEFLNAKPRNVKHMVRSIIPGTKDIGYPKPELDHAAIAAGASKPVMPGEDTLHVIDIVYRDED